MKTFLNEDEEKFYPTVEWMKQNYDKLNNELFDGKLGQCDFSIFTSGKGSQGGVLGWFQLQNRVKYLKSTTRQMYVQTMFGREMINENNFYNYCKPIIKLNGNYKWSEKAMLSTLAHEMCHYYTYMKGFVPKQGHGREFKQIGAYISAKSNGIFTVERLASAEEMSEMELNNTMQDKQNKREENKKSRLNLLFIYRNDGIVEMIPTTNKNLIDQIISANKGRQWVSRIVLSNDINLISMLLEMGYDRNLRTYKFYHVEGKDFANNIDNYDIDVVYGEGNNGRYENELKAKNAARKALLTNILRQLREFAFTLTKKMALNIEYDEDDCFHYLNDFKINILGLNVFVKGNGCKGHSTKAFIENDTLIMEFPPRMYNNQMFANDLSYYFDGKYVEECESKVSTMVYRAINEELDKLNKNTMNEVIRKEINRFMLEEFNIISDDEIGEITPNMNLGLMSPIEAES